MTRAWRSSGNGDGWEDLGENCGNSGKGASEFPVRDNWGPIHQQLGSSKRNRFFKEDISGLDMLSLGSLQFIWISMSSKWLEDGVQERRLD